MDGMRQASKSRSGDVRELAIVFNMFEPHDEEATASTARQSFATTHWSVVAAAGDSASPEAQAALEKLCQAY